MMDEIINLVEDRGTGEEGNKYNIGQEIGWQRSIPIVGYVAAGESSCPEYTDGDMPPGHGMFGDLELSDIPDTHAYAVIVRGDSMFPLYKEEDKLIVCPNLRWENRDSCLVRQTDGAVWVKRVTVHGEILQLESFNPVFPVISLHKAEAAYIHKVIMAISK